MKIKTLLLIAAGGLLTAQSTQAQYGGGFGGYPGFGRMAYQPPAMPMGAGGYNPFQTITGGYSPFSGGMASPYASMRGGWGRTGGMGGMMAPGGMSGPRMIQRNYTRRNLTRVPGLYGRPNYSRGVRGRLSTYIR